MKCPKCGYLGFEDADRCRNCGYEFSLSAPAALPDLQLKVDTQEKPFDEVTLPPKAPAEGDLPLFGGGFSSSADDQPLITRASAPRAPLAVRRATPEVPRLRTDQPRAQSLDLGPEDSAPSRSRQRSAAL